MKGGTCETCLKKKYFWCQCPGCGSGDLRHEHYSSVGLNVRHCLRNGSKKKGDHNFCVTCIETWACSMCHWQIRSGASMVDPPSGSFCAACALVVLQKSDTAQKRDTVRAADSLVEDLTASMSAMDIDSATPGGSSTSPMDISAGPVLGPHRGKCYHVRGVSVCQYTSAKRCALGTLELAFKNQEIEWVFCVDEHIERAVDIMLAWVAMRRNLVRQGEIGDYQSSLKGEWISHTIDTTMLHIFWKGEDATKVLGVDIHNPHDADGGLAEFCRRFVDMLTKLMPPDERTYRVTPKSVSEYPKITEVCIHS